jgi:hypothetical protein
MIDALLPSVTDVQAAILRDGYARLRGDQSLALMDIAPTDWRALAASWNDLGPDLYMADGGRYRRRRHAAFRCENGIFTRKPHQPHFQSRDYNVLNGDVQRWFDPVTVASVDNPAMRATFALCARVFGDGPWHVEMHLFRIEAQADSGGHPTPEGMHRDGVDKVLVMLIERRNVREGVTRIGSAKGAPLGEFTLASPGDMVLIDDHRIRHGVTEIHAVDPARPAWRDALVVTFRAD